MTHEPYDSRFRRRLFGMSMEELQALRIKIEREPSSLNSDKGSIFIFNKRARGKLNAIAYQIQSLLAKRE